jgi:hypothetical protein
VNWPASLPRIAKTADSNGKNHDPTAEVAENAEKSKTYRGSTRMFTDWLTSWRDMFCRKCYGAGNPSPGRACPEVAAEGDEAKIAQHASAG